MLQKKAFLANIKLEKSWKCGFTTDADFCVIMCMTTKAPCAVQLTGCRGQAQDLMLAVAMQFTCKQVYSLVACSRHVNVPTAPALADMQMLEDDMHSWVQHQANCGWHCKQGKLSLHVTWRSEVILRRLFQSASLAALTADEAAHFLQDVTQIQQLNPILTVLPLPQNARASGRITAFVSLYIKCRLFSH